MAIIPRDTDDINAPIPGINLNRSIFIVLCSTVPVAIILIILVGTVHCIKRRRRKAAVQKEEEEHPWPHQPLPLPSRSHETQRLSHEISTYDEAAPGSLGRSQSAPERLLRVYRGPRQGQRQWLQGIGA